MHYLIANIFEISSRTVEIIRQHYCDARKVFWQIQFVSGKGNGQYNSPIGRQLKPDPLWHQLCYSIVVILWLCVHGTIMLHLLQITEKDTKSKLNLWGLRPWSSFVEGDEQPHRPNSQTCMQRYHACPMYIFWSEGCHR